MTLRRLATVWTAGVVLIVARTAILRAQMGPSAFTRDEARRMLVVDSIAPTRADSQLQMPRVDAYEVSKFAGWGMAVGSVAGVGYAYARHGPNRLVMFLEGLVGGGIGMVGGVAAFIVRESVKD